MSIVSWRRLLLFAQIASVVALIVAAIEWRLHSARMERERAWPEFIAERVTETEDPIDAPIVVDRPIGRFPLAQPRESEAVPAAKPLVERLAELGEIIGSVVAIENGRDGIRSSITFRRTSGEISTIAVGEALETRPHPDLGPAIRLPVRYRFVGCEQESGATFFVFDTLCDGTRIERIQWMAASPSLKSAGRLRGIVVMDEKALQRKLRRSARFAPAPPND